MRDPSSLPDANSFKTAQTAVQAMAVLSVLAQRLTVGTVGLRDMQIEQVAEANLSILVSLMENTVQELQGWLELPNV